jgi:hypothetical protein
MKLKYKPMNFKLAALLLDVELYRGKYEGCHPLRKNDYYDKWMKARAVLKEYTGKQEIKITVKYKPSVRMDDWSENFENFIN